MIVRGAVEVATATVEVRSILVHSDFNRKDSLIFEPFACLPGNLKGAAEEKPCL